MKASISFFYLTLLMTPVQENLKIVQKKVRNAALRSGRTEESVCLIVVSKTWSAADVRPLMEAGQEDFGENRVQEALGKMEQLPDHLRWHLIGPLQSNKVRRILPHVSHIHSVDSLDLARRISRVSMELNLKPKLFLEINVAGETTKAGFSPEQLFDKIGALLEIPGLRIEGLMCIPPHAESAEAARPWFQKLRGLRDQLQEQFQNPLPGLSMGMSQDYEVAIEEGATHIRVGSAIFGFREPSDK